jgi:putative ABC transport system ATP-binding protein
MSVTSAREQSMSNPELNGAVVVSAHELTRRYGQGDTAVDALRGVSLDVARGKLTAVMGPSGSGKSTLMHILAGLDRPTSGDVTIAGQRINELDDNALTKLRREHIGFVFQFFNLLPMLSAEENIALPLSIAGEKPDPAFFEQLLDRVGLKDRRSHRPAELSGGQQQRVAIARALAMSPEILLLDEPTSALDPQMRGEVLAVLRDLAKSGMTMMVVTHEMAFARATASRVWVFDDGRLVEDGPPSQVCDSPQSERARAFFAHG